VEDHRRDGTAPFKVFRQLVQVLAEPSEWAGCEGSRKKTGNRPRDDTALRLMESYTLERIPVRPEGRGILSFS